MSDLWEGFREGFDMTFIPLAILALIIGLLWIDSVPAQEHKHPQEHVTLHEQFYQTWKRPQHRLNNGERFYGCCNKEDCAPAQFKRENGQLLGRKIGVADSNWYKIPEDIIESNQPDPRESPDGNGHLCATMRIYDPVVFCAVLGSGT